MPEIRKPDDRPLDPTGKVNLDAMLVPSFRIVLAVERGVERNILIKSCGGLGDLICSEPAIRFAFKHFHKENISLYTLHPTLYRHLPFKKIYDESNNEHPNYDNYFAFNTLMEADCLASEFMYHLTTNAVDYASISMWRSQLLVKDKVPYLEPSDEDKAAVADVGNPIVIHPGSGWQSKTFPKDWWDIIIASLREAGESPVIIGSNSILNHGTVDVETFGCLDLRNKLTTMQSVALLQKCKLVLTNDSAPLHMAATGNAWIGYVATAKHPDYIEHWRGPTPTFGWRMQNLGHGGVWDTMDMCPNHKNPINIDVVDPVLLQSWLPDPESVAEWAVEKIHGIHES